MAVSTGIPPQGNLSVACRKAQYRWWKPSCPSSRQNRDLKGLRYTIDMLHAYGITGVQDAIVSEDDLRTYRSLADAGTLNLHVEASLWWERDRGLEQIPEMVAQREQLSQGLLRANTVKIMQDGVMGELHRRDARALPD